MLGVAVSSTCLAEASELRLFTAGMALALANGGA
jgi:hypothetical protein